MISSNSSATNQPQTDLTDTVLVKVAELTGAALDWAVALAEGEAVKILTGEVYFDGGQFSYGMYSPSRNYAMGCSIIEKVGISTRKIVPAAYELIEGRHFDADKGDVIEFLSSFKREMIKRPIKPELSHNKWMAKIEQSTSSTVDWSIKRDFLSDDMLTAAIRCYVSVKLRRFEVEIHVSLMQ